MRFKVILLMMCLSLLSPFVQARELTDMSLEITTDKKGPEAKQDAFDQATVQATQRLTEEILGTERSGHLWATLQPKLLKNSTRFVLFVKGSAPIETPTGSKITVTLKLSPDNLETLLREEGVLSSGGVKVLPLVEVIDSRGSRYVWWTGSLDDDKSLPAELFKRFYSKLSAKFKAKNIYVLDPTNSSFRMSVPASYRSENLRREDQISFAQYLRADVVISGKIFVGRQAQDNNELRMTYDLQLWQAKSGREIGDVQRADPLSSESPKVVQAMLEQTDGKVVEELGNRLGDTIASGSLNLNVVKVSITGNMTYRQEAELKHLLGQVREIKVLRERLFEPSRVVLEAETPSTGPELAKIIQKTKFPQYAIAVDGSQDDSLALSVRPLASSSAQ